MAHPRKEARSDPRLKKCPFCFPSKALGPRSSSSEVGLGKEGRALVHYIDYKDYPVMKPFIDYFGNIRNRYYTGTCLKHQKMLKNAIERARFMGMLAYRK